MFPIGDDNSSRRTVPLVVLQFFSGIGSIAKIADTGGVAYMAHIGGFIAGFVLTFVFRGSRGVSVTS